MLRADIEIRANSFRVEDKGEQDDSDCEHKDHQKIMRRSFTNKKERHRDVYSLIGSECKTIISRKKPLRKHMLSANNIRQIILGVKSDHLSHREVANKFNVSSALVHRLLKANKNKPDFMESLLE